MSAASISHSAFQAPGDSLRRFLPESERRLGIVELVAEQAADHPHHRQSALRIDRRPPENSRLTGLGGSGRRPA